MTTLWTKIQASLLVIVAVGVLMLGSTQQCKAAYYDNYYSIYQEYLSAYDSTGNPYYYYTGYCYYYYYIAGLYADYYGYNYDPSGNKSDKHLDPGYYASFSYYDIYWNYYAYIGDYYYRIYNNVGSR